MQQIYSRTPMPKCDFEEHLWRADTLYYIRNHKDLSLTISIALTEPWNCSKMEEALLECAFKTMKKRKKRKRDLSIFSWFLSISDHKAKFWH